MANKSDKYCYSNNGISMRMVPCGYKAKSGESLFADQATPEQLAEAFPNYGAEKRKIDALIEIADLEKQQTPRRIREAALGVDNGWLDKLNLRLTELRRQLY